MSDRIPKDRLDFLMTWEGAETASYAEIVALAAEVKRSRNPKMSSPRVAYDEHGNLDTMIGMAGR